jgi:signal transduction histidine kinase
MMLLKLRRQLILQYTILTALILNIVIFSACYVSINQLKQYHVDMFENIRDTIVYKLQTENIINNTWLSEQEAANKLIIHIEENGSPFFFKGSWLTLDERKVLIVKAREAAINEGIDTSSLYINFSQNHSSILQLDVPRNIPNYACVSIIPNKKGYKSLTLIQLYPEEHRQIFQMILLSLLVDMIGTFLLFLISCLLVKKVIKPIEEGQQKQKEFIAAASHDLRSPLAVISTNASASLLEGADPNRFIPKIIDECGRMSKLISDMLILSSSDAKSWEIHKTLIDTETYLIDLYDSYSLVCQKSQHSLLLDFPDYPLTPICADKDRLTQVIGILIDNAINYSPSNSMITMHPNYKKNTFFLEVIDHGIGITSEHKKVIFDRFYRIDKARNDNTHFGLGLSIAKELIELQGGKISVSDTIGGGSTFILELPQSGSAKPVKLKLR